MRSQTCIRSSVHRGDSRVCPSTGLCFRFFCCPRHPTCICVRLPMGSERLDPDRNLAVQPYVSQKEKKARRRYPECKFICRSVHQVYWCSAPAVSSGSCAFPGPWPKINLKINLKLNSLIEQPQCSSIHHAREGRSRIPYVYSASHKAPMIHY